MPIIAKKGNEHIVYGYKFDFGNYMMAIGKPGLANLDLPWNTITEDVYKEIISMDISRIDDYAARQLERSKHEASMGV